MFMVNVNKNSTIIREARRPLVQFPVVGQGLMLSAFDYALGRRTYTPSIISAILSTAGQWLTTEQAQYVKSTIKTAVSNGKAGASFDVIDWLDLLEALDKYEAKVELDSTLEREWERNGTGDFLFPEFKDEGMIEDWWFLVDSAHRYDLQGDGRLALTDYKTLISLNQSILSEKWRMILMRDVECRMQDLDTDIDYSEEVEALEYYLWLDNIKINGKTADHQYLKNECITKAMEFAIGEVDDERAKEEC